MDIIIGIGLVIKDAFLDILKYILGFLKVIFSKGPKSRKEYEQEENSFKELLGKESYFVDIILSLLPFIIISHYSILAAPLVTFMMFFVIYNYKKQWYGNRNRSLPDDSLIFSYLSTTLIIVGSIVYMNIQFPYSYSEVGNVTLTEKDVYYIKSTKDKNETKKISRGSIDIEINSKIEGLDVKECKPGNYMILEESLEVPWFNVLKTDFYAECSKNIDIKKQLDGVKKIKTK